MTSQQKLACVDWHTGPNGASEVPWSADVDTVKLLDAQGELPQPPFPAYMQHVNGVPAYYFAADDVCPSCQAAIEAQYAAARRGDVPPMAQR